MSISTLLKESMETTLSNISPPKVSWVNSPFLELRDKSKKAVGDFGEIFVRDLYRSKGFDAEKKIRAGHDVFVSSDHLTKKIEVKTASQGKTGTFWFNQIYYESTDKGELKDWDFLCFVFVKPFGIEVWECKKPGRPGSHFRMNNGWSWQKPSSKDLDKNIWNKIYEENFIHG